MKFYKILFFFVLFLLMFIPISKCDFETSDIDINTIGDNYNNNTILLFCNNFDAISIRKQVSSSGELAGTMLFRLTFSIP